MIDFYNNGKVLIGSQYDKNPLKPKYVESDPDMIRLQKALIGDPDRMRKEYYIRMCYYIVITFVILVVYLKN
jgi:hypothetical protein